MPVALPDLAVTTPSMPITLQPAANDQGLPPLTIVGFATPAHGAVVLNPDQTMTYTPAAGFIGIDSFTYTLTDGSGELATGTVSVTVNDAPVANDDLAATATDMPVDIAVLDNDIDAGPLGIAAWSSPGHGDLEVRPDQTVRYVPQPGFTGSDSFTYTIADPYGLTATAMVSVAVAAANRPPVAADDAAATALDTPVSLDLLANDNDPDDDPLSLVGLGLPAHGSLAVGPGQTVTYTPAEGFVGEDELTYTVGDGRGGQASAAVRISVERPNSAPLAGPLAVTTQADTAIRLDLLAQASDSDGDPLQLATLTLPAHGRLTVNPDHSVTYEPAPGFTGEDGFTYTVTDGRGGSASAEARIEVEPPPVPPTYANGYATRRRIVLPPRPVEGEPAGSFVALISETGSWLRSQAHGGPVVSPAGADLRFELEDGTKLPHEIETYDGSTGRLLAWVRLPSWNPAATARFFLYLGKAGLTAGEAEPAAVWSDYLAVWDARTGVDRSGNGRHLTPGAVTAAELIGPAARFPGTTAATAAAAAFASGHAALSLQCWASAEPAALGSDRGLLQQGERVAGQEQGLLLRYAGSGFRGGGSNIVIWSVRTTAGLARLESAEAAHGTGPRSFHAVWRSGELPRLYLDGVATVPSWAGAITTTATAGQALAGTTQMAGGGLSLGAGSVAGDDGTWLGLIDEVRLRAAAPTAAWVAIEHASQADPQGFYGIGADEAPTEAAGSVVAVPRHVATGAGSRVDTDVLAAAYVPPGAPAPTVAAVSQPANGLATIVAGRVRYTPHAGFTGSDSFTYTLASSDKRSTARITVQVSSLQASYPPPLRTVQVRTSNELRSAVAAARPGDHIVLADGIYSGAALTVAVSGTATNPIVIRAANRVRLNTDGSVKTASAVIKHYLDVQGNHVWLYGLNIDGTGWTDSGKRMVNLFGTNGVVKRCRLYAWEGRCLKLHDGANDCEIAYCDVSVKDFSDDPVYPDGQARNPKRTGIGGDVDAKRANIHHNHFHDFPPKGRNYSEYVTLALLCGESPANGGVRTDWLVHHNLFARCNGGLYTDAAVFESKAGWMTFERNTVVDCIGHCSFRQGVNNAFISNWFRNVRAIRTMDGPHRVIGNVVENCQTGINILAGSLPYTTPQAQKDGFVQSYNVLCAGNRRIGSAGAFLRIGSSIGANQYPALNTRIEGWDSSMGNITYGTHSGTQGPFASTTQTWPAPVFLTPADVGPEGA